MFTWFSESGYTWDGIVVPGYQLIRIDTIGHGDSDIPEDESAFSIPTMLNDLHTVISAVAGESYSHGILHGGRLALLYALEYSSEIEKPHLRKVVLLALNQMQSDKRVKR